MDPHPHPHLHLHQVNVTLHRKTGRLEHHGIKIEFVGQIELYYDRGNHYEFLSLVRQLPLKRFCTSGLLR